MVADFPWDSKAGPSQTAAASQAANTANAASNGAHMRPQAQANAPLPSPTESSTIDGVKIKAEPDTEPKSPVSDIPAATAQNQAAANRAANGNTQAAQRAAALLQTKYGSLANKSINAMQSTVVKQEPNTGPVDLAAQKSPPPRNTVSAAQADGAGDSVSDANDDWVAVLARSHVPGDVDGRERRRADGMIRRQVEEAGQTMEAGGLLLPLRQHRPKAPRQRRRPDAANDEPQRALSATPIPSAAPLPSSSRAATSAGSISQLDGGNDADTRIQREATDMAEEDEDAINSDLDDPDDGLNNNDDDEDTNTPIMLCMYDKVQRTKNKWKCILKDGVLTVGGREYVFQKGTGEFEW